MPRRSLALILVTVVALLGAACSSGQTQSPGAAGSPGSGASAPPAASGGGAASPGGADITGTLLVGGRYGCTPAPCEPDQETEGTADEIAYVRYNTFAEQYPGVQLTFTETEFDAQQFLTSVAAGNPPDVIRIDRAIMGTFVAEGAIDPLDDCIGRFGIDTTQYREPAIASATINGSIYGIPDSYDNRVILVNDSVVEEAGLTPDDIDTSDWDALAQVNEDLLASEGGKITRIGFDPKLPEFLPLWAKANGASIVSDDGLTSQLEDPKVAEALDFAASLIKAHGSASSFLDFRTNGPGGVDFFGPDNQFVADTVGAFPMEQWYLNVLADNSPDEGISFVPFKDREGNDLGYSGGQSWAIPASAKNKDAACEFIRVVTLPDTWFAAAKTRADLRAADGEAFTGVFTGNSAADDRIFSELVTEQSAGNYFEGVQLVLETSDSAYSLPAIPGGQEFDTIWRGAVERVLNQGVSAAEALAQADQEGQAAIDDAK
jgi:multiple sugar transport system substrate-binding protein